MTGLALLAACFVVMGSLGCVTNPQKSHQSGIIAMAILAAFFRGLVFIIPNRVMLGELPHPQLREKTTFVAISASQLFDFASSFSFPYLLNAPYANLQSRIGFVYAPFAALGVAFLYFWVPDLSRRSLEEIEEIFRENVPAKETRREYLPTTYVCLSDDPLANVKTDWKSSNIDSAGARITAMENGSLKSSRSEELGDVSSDDISIKTEKSM